MTTERTQDAPTRTASAPSLTDFEVLPAGAVTASPAPSDAHGAVQSSMPTYGAASSAFTPPNSAPAPVRSLACDYLIVANGNYDLAAERMRRDGLGPITAADIIHEVAENSAYMAELIRARATLTSWRFTEELSLALEQALTAESPSERLDPVTAAKTFTSLMQSLPGLLNKPRESVTNNNSINVFEQFSPESARGRLVDRLLAGAGTAAEGSPQQS